MDQAAEDGGNNQDPEKVSCPSEDKKHHSREEAALDELSQTGDEETGEGSNDVTGRSLWVAHRKSMAGFFVLASMGLRMASALKIEPFSGKTLGPSVASRPIRLLACRSE